MVCLLKNSDHKLLFYPLERLKHDLWMINKWIEQKSLLKRYVLNLKLELIKLDFEIRI